MDYEYFCSNGRAVLGFDLCYFMRGEKRNWVAAARTKPKLASSIVSVTDESIVLRHNKTGGMAIFRRIQDDMRACAYGPAAGFW